MSLWWNVCHLFSGTAHWKCELSVSRFKCNSVSFQLNLKRTHALGLLCTFFADFNHSFPCFLIVGLHLGMNDFSLVLALSL